MHGVPVYRLRGALLPLVFLDEQLQLATTRDADDDLNIVVLQADDRPFGLVVDAIRDTEEIVVKPLQKQLKGISVFAGAAIMGDGRVALVLDVLGLAQRASVISGAKSRALGEHGTPVRAGGSRGQPLLLVRAQRGRTNGDSLVAGGAAGRVSALDAGEPRRAAGRAISRRDPAADRRSQELDRLRWAATAHCERRACADDCRNGSRGCLCRQTTSASV